MTTKRLPTAASPVSIKLDAEELRQAFADEAEKAWLDYEQTGLHVTHAGIDVWAKSLGTRRPKRLPKWHK